MIVSAFIINDTITRYIQLEFKLEKQKMSSIQQKLIYSIQQPTKKLKTNLLPIIEQINNNDMPTIIETFKVLQYYLRKTDNDENSGDNLSLKVKKSVQFINDTSGAFMKMNAMFVVKCLISLCFTPIVMEFIEAYILPDMLEDALTDFRQNQQKRGLDYFMKKDRSFFGAEDIQKIQSYGYNYVRLSTQLIKIGSIIKPQRLICNQYTTDPSPFAQAFQKLHANLFHPPQTYLYIKQSPQKLHKSFEQKLKKITDEQFDDYSSFIGKQFSKQLKLGFKQKQSEGIRELDYRKLMLNGNPLLTQHSLEYCDNIFQTKKTAKNIYFSLQYIDDLILSGNYEAIIFIQSSETIYSYYQQIVKMRQNNTPIKQFLSQTKGKQRQKQALIDKLLSSLELWAKGMGKFSCKASKEYSKIFKYYQVLKDYYCIQFPENQQLQAYLAESNRAFQSKLSTAQIFLAQMLQEITQKQDQITKLFNKEQYDIKNKKQRQQNKLLSNQSSASIPNKIQISKQLLKSPQNNQRQGTLLNLSSIKKLQKSQLSNKKQQINMNIQNMNMQNIADENILDIPEDNPHQISLSAKIKRSINQQKIHKSKQIISSNILPHKNKRQSTQYIKLDSTENIQIKIDKYIQHENYDCQRQLKDSKKLRYGRKINNQKSRYQKQKENYSVKLHKVDKVANNNVKNTDSMDIIQQSAAISVVSETKKMPVSDFSHSHHSQLNDEPSILNSVHFVDNKIRNQESYVENYSQLDDTAEVIIAPSVQELDSSYHSNFHKNKQKDIKKTFHEVINNNQSKNAQTAIRKYNKIFELSQECQSLVRSSSNTKSNISFHGSSSKSINKQNYNTWKSGKSEHCSGIYSAHKSANRDTERILRLLENSKKKHEQDLKIFENQRQKSLRAAQNRNKTLQKQKLQLSQLVKKKDQQIRQLRQNSSNRNSHSQHHNYENQQYFLKKLSSSVKNRNTFKPSYSLRKNKNSHVMSIQLPSNGHFVNHLKYKRYFDNCKPQKTRKMVLKNKQLLYKNDQIEIGYVGCKQSHQCYNLTLYITSEYALTLNQINCVNNTDLQTLSLQISHNIKYPLCLKPKFQQKIAYKFKLQAIPYTLPIFQISYTSLNNKKPNIISTVVACPIQKFMHLSHQYDWSTYKKLTNIRSKQFPYSRKILKQLDNIKDYLQNIKVLGENSIGETIYGAYAETLFGNFPLKIIVKKNQFMYIEIGLKDNQKPNLMQMAEFLISTLNYLFVKQLD